MCFSIISFQNKFVSQMWTTGVIAEIPMLTLPKQAQIGSNPLLSRDLQNPKITIHFQITHARAMFFV